MRRAFFFPGLWLVACVLGSTTTLVVGCSDTDPNYGPPGAIYNSNYKPILGGSTSGTSGSGGTSGTSGTTPADPKAAFAAFFDATKSSCGSCHANLTSVNGKPDKLFFAPAGTPTADATLAAFKTFNLTQPAATNPFYNVAAGHPGPALTADQKKAMDAWLAAEASGGGASDAGGGG